MLEFSSTKYLKIFSEILSKKLNNKKMLVSICIQLVSQLNYVTKLHQLLKLTTLRYNKVCFNILSEKKNTFYLPSWLLGDLGLLDAELESLELPPAGWELSRLEGLGLLLEDLGSPVLGLVLPLGD